MTFFITAVSLIFVRTLNKRPIVCIFLIRWQNLLASVMTKWHENASVELYSLFVVGN